MNELKEIDVYPYQCFILGMTDPDKIFKHFSKLNFRNNESIYGEEKKMSLIVERNENGILFGVLSKLKNENLWVRNEDTGEADEFSLENNTYLEDPTHFVWNPRTGILFADYNRDSFRILSDTISEYLIFNLHSVKENVLVKPFFIKDALAMILKSEFAIQLSFNVTRPNETFIDDAGFGRSSVLGEIATDGIPFVLKIGDINGENDSKKIGKATFQRIVNAVVKDKERFKSANIVIDDGVKYDLLKPTYIRYPANVSLKGKHLDHEDVYNKIFQIFSIKHDKVYEMIPEKERGLRLQAGLDKFLGHV